VKQVSILMHLLAGIAVLAILACVVYVEAHRGRQQLASIDAQPAKRANPNLPSDDSILEAAEGKKNVFDLKDEAAGGSDASPMPSTSSDTPAYHERVNPGNISAANHFLHGRFPLTTSKIFRFEVPPRALRPELRGTFRTVATRQDVGGSPSVEVVLLNEEEFASFVSHKSVVAMYTSNPSSRGNILWELKANVADPQKNYLVFRNSTEGQRPIVVDADFSASFE
jgi:hypothetical protein